MSKACVLYLSQGTVVVLCRIIILQPSTEVTKITFATTDKIRINVKNIKRLASDENMPLLN